MEQLLLNFTSSPILLTSLLSVVLISNQILFFDNPSITPSFFSITSEQTDGDGRQVIIKSTFWANSFGESMVEAPFAAKFFVREESKSITVKSNLLRNKLFANFPPTFPKPIKPTFILTSNHFFSNIVEIVDKSPSLST